MIKANLKNYSGACVLALILFGSLFIGTSIFNAGYEQYSVWLLLAVFSFADGWFINKTIGWNKGGKIIFSVIIAAVLVSLFVVSLFRNYFAIDHLLSEDLFIFAIRIISIGVFGYFGLSVAEIFHLQQAQAECERLKNEFEEAFNRTEKEIELTLKEAKLKSEKMIFDAEKKVNELSIEKNRIQKQLHDLIQIEKELINKFENED